VLNWRYPKVELEFDLQYCSWGEQFSLLFKRQDDGKVDKFVLLAFNPDAKNEKVIPLNQTSI
jgi:hypothetical protein